MKAARLRKCALRPKTLQITVLRCAECGAPLVMADGACRDCPPSRDDHDPVDDKSDIR
jgi:hypothetical protein